MINNLSKILKNYVLVGSLALATVFPSSALANDIFKGVRGPTNWQLDERVIYSKNEKNLEILTNNTILKYWDGNKFGKWGFISLPYKLVSSKKGSKNGLGDITIGIGPRGRIDNFNWFLYGALKFPTGDSKGKIALGNGKYDKKIGFLLTYLSTNKKFEVDGSLEYNFTREKSIGLLVGGEITDKIRFATGLTNMIRENGDYLLNSRSVVRYKVSRNLHFEVVGDLGINSKNVLKRKNLSLFVRYNF